jgi:hypothetical protein
MGTEHFMTTVRKQLITYLLTAPFLIGSLSAFAQQEVLHGVNVQDEQNVQSEQRDTAELNPEENATTPFVSQNLTLFQTTIRTAGDTIRFSQTQKAAAFMPTTMVCPATHAAGCTIKVEVSANTTLVPTGNVVLYDLVINGSGPPVDPNEFIPTDSVDQNDVGTMHTAEWVKRTIPPGASEVVNVNFLLNTNIGSAAATFRTETVQLFLN